MGRVIILDEETIGKIAAGEVIERPASVVKELVENSLDAEAKHILVEIVEGGRKLIRVVDDGIGMSKEDAVLALQKHSTSKIHSAEDLYNITTLGFRGEALPSIAAVSQMRLLTKSQEDASGVEIKVEAGIIREMREIGLPQGTTVIVENLFFNTPARLKFLRSPQTELAYILSWLQRFALSHHDVSFRALSADREIFNHISTDDLLEAIASIMGEEIASQMLPVEAEEGEVRIYGFISRPPISRATRQEEYFFVNRRFVRSRLLNIAIDEAMISAVPSGRYPICVLFVDIPPYLVDVNVHPMKLEVKFVREKEIFSFLRNAIAKAISQPVSTTFSLPNRQYKTSIPSSKTTKGYPEMEETEAETPTLPFEEKTEVYPRILGHIAKTYIVVEWQNELMLVDQHAAHERIIFEKLLKRKKLSIRESSQEAVFPLILHLSPAQFRLVSQWLPLFEELGFQVELFGKQSIIVRSAPGELEGKNIEEVVRDIIDELTETPEREAKIGLEEIAATTSCKLAIKAGDRLEKEEMKKLIEELLNCENPSICPHGRPTYIIFPFSDLERRFKR
ncbi:DNA mismatch repair endonuclease MutL [bacterium]|nr:DNA mismatch repair endonuclease MutL [bacterium]